MSRRALVRLRGRPTTYAHTSITSCSNSSASYTQSHMCGNVVHPPRILARTRSASSEELVRLRVLGSRLRALLATIGRDRMVHQPRRALAQFFGFLLVGVVVFSCGSSGQSGGAAAGGKCTTSQDCAGQPCVSGVCQSSTNGGSDGLNLGGSTSN